ncbi:hypothetical protein EUX98_g3769 [Antrodiella citrinella]|uniref:Uncharacterized protein n=1 Tax=Antrodiella citrinella TaxID=2447956 RepID=A0A4S4MYH9_9APHY|nr:hypothetical protein EUX98_g3769 [Antrodiella citrinella]
MHSSVIIALALTATPTFAPRDELSSSALNFKLGKFIPGSDFKRENLDSLAREGFTGDTSGVFNFGQFLSGIDFKREDLKTWWLVAMPKLLWPLAPPHGGTTAPSADPSVNAPLADPPVGAPSADPVSKRFMTRPHAIFNRRIMTRPRTIFYIRETGPIIRDSDELHPHPWNGAHLLPSESPHPRSLYELD